MRFTLIISLLLAILAVVFALQNPQQATVDLFTTTFQGSTALILIVTFAIGVLVGILGAIPGWLRNRRKVNSLQKTIAEREDQVRRERETTRELAVLMLARVDGKSPVEYAGEDTRERLREISCRALLEGIETIEGYVSLTREVSA